jgi:hypothetical protein
MDIQINSGSVCSMEYFCRIKGCLHETRILCFTDEFVLYVQPKMKPTYLCCIYLYMTKFCVIQHKICVLCKQTFMTTLQYRQLILNFYYEFRILFNLILTYLYVGSYAEFNKAGNYHFNNTYKTMSPLVLGDHIALICAYWEIVYFGRFVETTEIAKTFRLLFST